MATGTTGAPGNIPFPVGSDQYALVSDLAGMASQINLGLANAGGPETPRPPRAHGHSLGDVQGLESLLAAKAAANDPRLSDARTPTPHSHVIGDISDLNKISTAYEVAQAEGFSGTVDEWLESLVGAPGKEGPYGGTVVTDPQVASYVTSDTATRAALLSGLTSTGTQPVGKGELAVRARDLGLVGDGVADDTNALRTALTSGRTVVFDEGATYSYDPTAQLVVTAGTHLHFRGARLHERVSYDRPSIRIEGDTYIDRLDVSIAGGALSRGVAIVGSDVHVGSLRVAARSQAGTHFRQRGVSIGDSALGPTARVHLGDVYVTGWDYAFGVQAAQDVTVGSVTIRSSRQGVWVTDSKRVSIANGSSDGLSPNATGKAGENSVLLEATVDGSTHDIAVSNFQSYISGEHGFRIGGQFTIARVAFTNCYATKAGSGIGSGVKPDNNGGCGFKVLGPTGNSDNLARHSNIAFLDCVVENTNGGKTGDNVSAFNVGKCRNVRIVNPVVRAAPITGYGESSYSAWAGVSLIGCENVDIVSPVIERCSFAGVHIFNINEPAGGPTWGPDPAGIRVIGGTIDHCPRGVNVALDGKILRRLNVTGTVFNGGEYAVHVANAVMNRCYLDITAVSQTIGTTLGTELVMGSLKGDLVGDAPMRGGSMFMDYAAYTLKVRTGSGWKAVATAA